MKTLAFLHVRMYIRASAAVALLWLSACTAGFQELNTNPTQVTNVDPLLMFSNMQLRTAGDWFEQQTYNYTAISCVVQHLSPKTAEFAAEMYRGMPNAQWEWWYAGRGIIGQPGIVKFVTDIIERAKKDPNDVNILSAARIWRAFIFHRITDLFGDVPYFQAGRGFYDRNFTPKYDTQEEIYRDMLKELREAVAAFDNTKRTLTTNDGVYRGDLTRWRRFGNSLRLRLAMRLTKVDPATARREAEEAIAAGVMQSNADMAWIDHANGARVQQSPTWQTLNQFDDYRLSETFVSLLDSTNDPRLRIINNEPTRPNRGLPNGITSVQRTNLGSAGLARVGTHLASPNRDSPSIFMTYAEVEFLMAEAAWRGWRTPRSAREHYEAGIRAAMTQYSICPNNPPIPTTAQIDAYIAHPRIAYNQANALEQIITQKWICTFLDGLEPYAEWRRTGFPRLRQLNPVGNVTGGQVPRRCQYPQSEQIFNPDGVNAALARLNINEYNVFLARVWWDRP
ncbi:MAG: SusD/RagB family nutrient-binding outer membrane lipoprotein [Bacteroidota bacterium]|nr:SusD/RagB family nutrient-binding outer membrane lipoprotein [Candidatus Kapabacteria bacterium]MDW8219337.1 SusD/RagB family nutrient-binding outer membrane lipoprotein [Bacteroidota bacterium]